jgi:cell division protein FtsZ
MGTGFGTGENRAVEAAQEAISSPLLDNVTIEGAGGVLINITGGMDLTIDEVTTIASIIQEAAGDNAEIIFGAVHDPSLEGDVRVTVIATGLEQEMPVQDNVIRPQFGTRARAGSVQAQAFAAAGAGASGSGARAVGGAGAGASAGNGGAAAGGADQAYGLHAAAGATRTPDYVEALPFSRPPQAPIGRQQLLDLDIPTFIRRQMD